MCLKRDGNQQRPNFQGHSEAPSHHYRVEKSAPSETPTRSKLNIELEEAEQVLLAEFNRCRTAESLAHAIAKRVNDGTNPDILLFEANIWRQPRKD